MINNLTDVVDTETLISQLSFVKDASDIIKAKEEEDKAKPKDSYDDLYSMNEVNDANNVSEQMDNEETINV